MISLPSCGQAKRVRLMGPTGQLRAARVFKTQGGCGCRSVSSPQLLPEMECETQTLQATAVYSEAAGPSSLDAAAVSWPTGDPRCLR